MRILWIGTKLPWPPRDGGRLLALTTLEALVEAGHAVTVVAPADREVAPLPSPVPRVMVRAVPGPGPAAPSAWLRARLTGRPLTIARHDLVRVRAVVADLVAGGAFDVVHAEQLQALAQAAPAARRGIPVVVRAQNVESDLWAALARGGGLRGWLARGEARRLARHEGRLLAAPERLIAVTPEDAGRLAQLAGRDAITIPAPFPATLPAGGPALPGRPALVVLAGGWLPNRDGAAWFVRQAWPGVLSARPGAALHIFGVAPGARWAQGPGIRLHPAPAGSGTAFPPGTILVVPLRIASGVRVKILEAWARGVPVVATPEAAAGLGVEDGQALLVAREPRAFAAAIGTLDDHPERGAALAAAGRAILTRRHDPGRVAAALSEVYAAAGGR